MQVFSDLCLIFFCYKYKMGIGQNVVIGLNYLLVLPRLYVSKKMPTVCVV